MRTGDTIASRLSLSETAARRAGQRGYRKADLPLLLHAARRIDDRSWLLTETDAEWAIGRRTREIRQLQRRGAPCGACPQARIAGLKREIAQLGRLKGSLLVATGDTMLTVERLSPARMKRLLRYARAAGAHREPRGTRPQRIPPGRIAPSTPPVGRGYSSRKA